MFWSLALSWNVMALGTAIFGLVVLLYRGEFGWAALLAVLVLPVAIAGLRTTLKNYGKGGAP